MIITLTINPCVDASSSVAHVVPDNKLRCKEPFYEPGGGGINVSRAIKRLGGESLALYTSGGLYGEMLQQLLEKGKIKHEPILIKELTRENLIVEEKLSGNQFRFDLPGPHLKENEWKMCLDKLSSVVSKSDYIVASGSLPPGVPDDFYARAAIIAKDKGARIIVDTSGEALHLAARSGVYLLKPNVRELAELTKQEISNEAELKKAAMKFIKEEQCEVVVVSLGAGGALLVTNNGYEHFRTPIVPIKSKVGAGDSMVGGIILNLEQGKSLRDAVLFGIAAGAAAVMNPQRELCRRQDAEELFSKIIIEQKRV
ncbi:MAG: 1-phosphofructokinase family hexose kinase [Candidatus Omnitrophica bacterium]|nr:1-phosphofructokinase family hexose kinase [Candidatus Omnitrophota bacterium]